MVSYLARWLLSQKGTPLMHYDNNLMLPNIVRQFTKCLLNDFYQIRGYKNPNSKLYEF